MMNIISSRVIICVHSSDVLLRGNFECLFEINLLIKYVPFLIDGSYLLIFLKSQLTMNDILQKSFFGGRGCPRGVMVKVMDWGIVVSEFVLQSRYYVHFRANTLGKGMNPPYPPSYGLNSTTTVLLGE